jgi:hypothetical protein
MPKEKPLTLTGLIKYNNEILLPAISEIMDNKIKKLENKVNSNFDKVFGDLETIKQEKTIGSEQDKRQKKFNGIVVNHLETGKTSAEELSQIKELNVL